MNIISFSDRDLVGIQNLYDDAILISMIIAKDDVKKILGNSGSSIDVLFYNVFIRMGLPLSQLRWVSILLVSFSGYYVRVDGEITLFATTPSRLSTIYITFMIVRIPSVYNVILG